MKVFVNPYEAGRWAPGAVIAIGKFDGVHRGHRRLLLMAARRARDLATRSLVLTFDPLPQEFFGKKFRPLIPLEERLRRIGELGLDGAVVLPFDKRLACQAPESFAERILGQALKAMEVLVGTDFCYGKDRSGDVATLAESGRRLGFSVSPVPLLRAGGRKIDSSHIRALLKNGRRAAAERRLGRPLRAKDR